MTAEEIPDEEFLFAVRIVEHYRGVFDLGEVGEILVGYSGPVLWKKADDLMARGLLSGKAVYRVTPDGRAAVRAYGREMMSGPSPQEALL